MKIQTEESPPSGSIQYKRREKLEKENDEK